MLDSPVRTGGFLLDYRRWFVLACFSACSLNQCFCNMTFSSLQEETMQAYFGASMDKATTNMLMNWGPVFGIACFPAAAWLGSQPNGLWKTIWCSYVLCFLGALIRSLPILIRELGGSDDVVRSGWAFVCYHIGQSFVAAAGPFVMGAVTLLSLVWFAESERTSATAIAQTANSLGATVAYLTPLWLVPSAESIPNMFYFSLALACVPIVGALVYLPPQPKHFPSAAAESAAHARSSECRHQQALLQLLISNPSFVTLILCCGMWSGFNIGWSSLFQTILGPVGISERSVAWMGFANGFATNVAGIISGIVMDVWFRHRLKAGMLVGAFGNLVCLVIFTLSLPCCGVAAPNSIIPSSDSSLAFILTCAGFFQGIQEPLSYALSAELLYPAKESTSAGFLVFSLNCFAGLMIFSDTFLTAANVNYVMSIAALILLCSLVFGVREEYRRPSDRASRDCLRG
eukprot:TRINITY_DN25897_c0_g1_i1.p1 TRINITY_DN25897_c0_g1~~TRINITY_DN25897_c0_g1_i1.p1  ORF type:complete len:477 (+),score=36.96 TRINITY_DN25897_c0_g1_i1:57-1433(+)